jgi:very-short-patch-repair endonuclease
MEKENKIVCAVREAKKNATRAELLMLAKLRFHGFRVIFQHPVESANAFYVADFFIPRKGLIIEIDGAVHNTPEQQRKDVRKDNLYEHLGYHVLRIPNTGVDTFDTGILHNYRRRKCLEWDDTPRVNQKKKRIKREHKANKNRLNF